MRKSTVPPSLPPGNPSKVREKACEGRWRHSAASLESGWARSGCRPQTLAGRIESLASYYCYLEKLRECCQIHAHNASSQMMVRLGAFGRCFPGEDWLGWTHYWGTWGVSPQEAITSLGFTSEKLVISRLLQNN